MRNLTSKFNELLIHFTGVYTQSSKRTSKILVVPSTHYVHKQKTLVQASNKDIKNLIAIESKSLKPKAFVTTDIVKNGEACTINFYAFDAEWVIEHAQKALFLVPESWIISFAMSARTVLGIEEMFIANTDKGVSSIQKSPLMSSAYLFAESNGIAPDNVVVSDLGIEYWVYEGMKNVPVRRLLGMFNPSIQSALYEYDYRPAIVCSALVLGVYLGLSSLFYYWKLQSLNEEITTLTPQLSNAFSSANSTEMASSSLERYQSLLNTRMFTVPIWLALKPIYEANAKLTFVRYLVDGSFTVAIEAESASGIINQLSEVETIDSVTLIGDVQRLKSKEKFQVSIKLAGNKQI